MRWFVQMCKSDSVRPSCTAASVISSSDFGQAAPEKGWQVGNWQWSFLPIPCVVADWFSGEPCFSVVVGRIAVVLKPNCTLCPRRYCKMR